jgi:hypothetical protein
VIPAISKWRIRVSHPARGAHETPLSAGPSASCSPRYRTGHTGLMTTS